MKEGSWAVSREAGKVKGDFPSSRETSERVLCRFYLGMSSVMGSGLPTGTTPTWLDLGAQIRSFFLLVPSSGEHVSELLATAQARHGSGRGPQQRGPPDLPQVLHR